MIRSAIRPALVALVHIILFDVTGDASELDDAQGALDAAQDLFTRAQASQLLAIVANIQATIDARISE